MKTITRENTRKWTVEGKQLTRKQAGMTMLPWGELSTECRGTECEQKGRKEKQWTQNTQGQSDEYEKAVHIIKMEFFLMLD